MRAAYVDLRCRAVLFDLDGVLVDSTGSAERAWSQWATEYSLRPEVVLAGLHGRRSIDTVSTYLPEPARAEALARIEALEQGDAAGIAPVAGAAALLSTLPHNWAIVTSGTPALLAVRLAAAGLPTPPVEVTGDDVTTGKPAPDGYLKAAADLGVPITDCVVVEDAPAGVQAGRVAGAGYVLGVSQRALNTSADPVVHDLQGVTWTGSGLRVSTEHAARLP